MRALIHFLMALTVLISFKKLCKIFCKIGLGLAALATTAVLAAPAVPVIDQALRQANSQWVFIGYADMLVPLSVSVPAADNSTYVSWKSVSSATLYQMRYLANGVWSNWQNSTVTQSAATSAYVITAVEVRACDASSCSLAASTATQIYNPAANATNTNEVTYFHNDNAGTPLVATDVFGNTLWKENYRPYGGTLNNEPNSVNNKLWFAGKPFDSSSGLSYSGGRYYDPVVGRFTGIDPKGFDPENLQTFNRYAYANNNPYKFVDPDGHSPVDLLFLAYDIGKLGAALYTGEGIGAASLDVALSVVGTLSPIPGTGQYAKRFTEVGVEVASIANKAADAKAASKVCCFVAGTLVQTADGDKAIELIKLGDLVYSKNVDTGAKELKPVTHLFKKLRPILELKVVSNTGFEKLIETTEDHPFFIASKGWVHAADLVAGDTIESNREAVVTVVSAKATDRVTTTYNLEVADFHTYYATEFGLLVHNCDIEMKGAGPKERTKGSMDEIKQAVNNAGYNKEKLECCENKLATSIENRKKDNGGKLDESHKDRVNDEREQLEKVQRRLKDAVDD